MSVVLDVKNLSVFYRQRGSGLFAKPIRRQVLFDVSFQIKQGEILGLTGKSGSGKSSLARAVLGLQADKTGQVIHHTKRPQMVFQDPYSSLSPRMTVLQMVEEPLIILGQSDKAERHRRVTHMLNLVGLDAHYLYRYPKELSGGQRQRVSIAAALIQKPQLLIADEPVSAVDMTTRAQIIRLICDLKAQMQLSLLFISHDLALVERICDRTIELRDGKIAGEQRFMAN